MPVAGKTCLPNLTAFSLNDLTSLLVEANCAAAVEAAKEQLASDSE